MLLGTGARISEILSLDRREVDSQTREVKIVGKGRKQRVLFFTDRAQEWHAIWSPGRTMNSLYSSHEGTHLAA
jgi:site-specific recombinase XerC